MNPHRPSSTIFVGVDDTDVIGSPGTGQLARRIAGLLAERGATSMVSRHQLLVHPDVPMTKNNSANVLHVTGWPQDLIELFDFACGIVREHAADGSDPAVCVGVHFPQALQSFGRRAQREIVTPKEAQVLADGNGVHLRAVSDTDDGLVGALSGAALASTGNDGRFILVGQIRELAGTVSIEDILAAGVTRVCLVDGTTLTEGTMGNAEKIRPSMVGGRPVLFAEPEADGSFKHVRFDQAPPIVAPNG